MQKEGISQEDIQLTCYQNALSVYGQSGQFNESDWKQDIQLLGALNIPIGKNGTEYGGIRGLQTGQYLSSGPSVFVQLAWYF